LEGDLPRVAFTFQIPYSPRRVRGMILIILCILRYAGWNATNLILGPREGHFGFDEQGSLTQSRKLNTASATLGNCRPSAQAKDISRCFTAALVVVMLV
jgi:hypothetical protein